MNSPSRLAVVCAMLTAACIGCTESGKPIAYDASGVTLHTANGIPIAAKTFPAESLAGLVLVHSAGLSASSWGAFAERAQRNGYRCIAIDLAGHGQSFDADAEDTNSDEFWRARLGDVDAAVAWLIESGCSREWIALAGAGVGANLSLSYASGRDDLGTVIALSAGEREHGLDAVRAMEGLRRTPVLIVAAEGDSYAMASGRALEEASAGFCEFRSYPGTLYGEELVNGSESVASQIMQWLETTVPLPAAL